MAGKHTIEVIDLTHLGYVRGGVDKQTQAVQAAIAQATTAIKGVADRLAPKSGGVTDMLMHVMSKRSGSGPSSAPALPPSSTLTR